MKKTVLIINNDGEIKKILDDDYLIIKNKKNFIECINTDEYNKYFDFMHKLSQGKILKNLTYSVVQNGDNKSFFANASKISNDEYVLILSQSSIKNYKNLKTVYEFYDLKFNEDKVANNFDELSRINNKLINIQRKFTRANFKLRNLNIQLKSIIESIQECLVLVDLEGDIIISNSNYNDFFNEELNVFELIESNNENLYKNIISFQGENDYLHLNDIKLKSHIDRFFDVKVVPIFDDEDKKKYYVITFDDVTKRMKNVRRLRNLKIAFNQSKENIAITDTNFDIIFANQSFISEYGYTEEQEVLNSDIRELIKKIKKSNKNELIEREIFYNKRITGEYFPVEISKSEVELGTKVISYIYFVKNISEQLEHEEKLILLAKKDQMTDTYSREAGLTYLKDYLASEESLTDEVSILFLDINALKDVNDNFGHQAGDELIYEVVDAIKQSTRSNDIIARLGGDEFLIILPDSDRSNAEMIKTRIKNVAQNKNNTKDFLVSVSIGIASSNEIQDGNTDTLMNLADHRMYEEKELFYSENQEKLR